MLVCVGAMTVKITTQLAELPEPSMTVTVIGCTPGPTMVPEADDWEHTTAPQLSLAQTDTALHRSGMTPAQA